MTFLIIGMFAAWLLMLRAWHLRGRIIKKQDQIIQLQDETIRSLWERMFQIIDGLDECERERKD